MSGKHTATPWHLVDNDMYFEIVVPWKSGPKNIDQYCPKICTVSYEDNDGIVGKPNAEFIVRACNAHDELVSAAAKQLEWIDKERKGPVYPEGTSRDSEGGEAIWRQWWNEQLELCADTEALCRSALAKATGEQP